METGPLFIVPSDGLEKPGKVSFLDMVVSIPGPKVIKLFMLNSFEHTI